MTTRAMKTERVLVAEASNAAGSQTVSSAVDVAEALGLVVTAKVSNGSTGPGEGCAFVMEVSTDGANWQRWSRQQAGAESNETYTFVVELPAAVRFVRATFTGNTDEAVTVEAIGHELTGLSHS